MRHKIKRILTLSINLLHSDKSTYDSNTYFYKDKLLSVGSNKGIKHTYSGLWFQTIPLSLFAFVFLLVLGLTVCPLGMGGEKTYAAATMPDPDFSIQLSMGDTLQSEEEVEVGVVGYIANNFTISTTSAESYSIYLAPDTADGYTNKLIGEKYQDEITGVGSNVVVGEFGRNTWGYGLTDANSTTTANSALAYSTIPDGSKPVKTVLNPDDGNDTYKLVFAARINDDKPADHYQSQAVLSVVGSPKNVTLTTLSDITKMQEMTPTICSNSTVGESNSLLDGRTTATSYTVKKLSDNKCWMTNNLRLVNKIITPADSDVTSDFTIPAPSDPWSSSVGDEGNMVYYADNITHGVYYTWYAATAGTGTSSVTSGNAPSSICPKGWRLPTGGSNGDFQVLYNVGHSNWTTSNGVNGYWFGGTSSSVAGAAFFTASGYIYNSLLDHVNENGLYWSSTASDGRAYNLYIDSSRVGSGDNYFRYSGYSVRCVAR